MTPRGRTTLTIAAFVLGLALLFFTFRSADLPALLTLLTSFGALLPLAFVSSAVWHLLRTLAWQRCFPAGSRPPFWRLFRVRLAAEAFSFVTVRGVAGEPLKVVLLADSVPAATSTAAVALERLAFIAMTAAAIGAGSVVAIATMSLSRSWTRVFAVCGAGSTIAVALLLLALRYSGRASASHPDSPSKKTSWLRAAVRAVGQQMSMLARDTSRLRTLAVIEACVFLSMVSEVWFVLRLIHVPISAAAAFSIEVFTRAASVASAFIPANIGALEASNVAAARALGILATGATALALVRRCRGLLWCAIGFLCYFGTVARQRHHTADTQIAASPAAQRSSDTTLVISDAGARLPLTTTLGGLPIGERILRAADRAGYGTVLIWTLRPNAWKAVPHPGRISVAAIDEPREWLEAISARRNFARFTALASGIVPSADILEDALRLESPAPVSEVPCGRRWRRSGVFSVVRPAAANLSLLTSLAAPLSDDEPSDQEVVAGDARLSLCVPTADDLPRAEHRLRQSIYKATDGALGRMNRQWSLPVSIALVRSCRLSPHVMSIVVMLMGFAAGWLFSDGGYAIGIAAALVSWAASVLDGCDGELARLQFKQSAFGCWLDTFGDYTYYIAIFAGLTVGSVRRTQNVAFVWIGAALIVGTLITLALLIVLRRRITGSQPERLRTATKSHFYARGRTWTWLVAKLSNCATRATAPYGILALALMHLLPVVVVLGAIGAQIYWVSLSIELRRLLHPESIDTAAAFDVRPQRPTARILSDAGAQSS